MDHAASSTPILGNRYQLLQTLGTGGMAVVYRARDLRLERPVAIKVLREDYSKNETFRQQFRQEALAAAKKLENEQSGKMQVGIAMIYAKYGDADQMAYYERIFKSDLVQGFDKIGMLNSMTFFASRQEPKIQRRALPIYEYEYKNGGMYTQMFTPQYINFLKDNLLGSIEKFKAEEEKAKKDGNANAADIARGKRTDAEALLADYEKMIASFPKETEGEAGH